MCENHLTVQQGLYYPWVEPGIHLTPEDSSRDVEPTPDLPLRQTMDELGKVMSQSTGGFVPLPSDGFTRDSTEMDEQRGGEGSYQGGRGSKPGLVDLRDRDVERGEGWNLVQILEGR